MTAQTVDIDYLRNGGFALFEDQEPVVWANGSALVDDPDPSPAPPSTSDWATTIKSTRTANAGQMIAADSDLTRLMIATEGGTPQSFLVKGVAYSPHRLATTPANLPTWRFLLGYSQSRVVYRLGESLETRYRKDSLTRL